MAIPALGGTHGRFALALAVRSIWNDWNEWWQRPGLRRSGAWPRRLLGARRASERRGWGGWRRGAPRHAPDYAPILDLSSSDASRVWLALSRNAEGVCQLVVLKTLADARARDERARVELMDEARLAARMNHPNVVRLQGLQTLGALPVLVLEHLAGPSLTTLLATAGGLQRFSLELRLTILVRLLSGLDHVHRLRDFDGRPLRVVHGAVSPDNVVVTYDGVVKLIDFGRARAHVSRIPVRLDRRRLPYAPPEQFSGEPDARGDIFSAGVLLWELAANRPLWANVPAPNILRRLLAGDLPRLREVAPAVDEELDRICTRALSPRPEGRYRTAAELRSDLERYLASRGAPVSDAALAAFVSAACRDQRRETERVIEARLVELGVSFPRVAAGADVARAAGPLARLERLERRPAAILAAAIVAASIVIALALSLTFPRAAPAARPSESREAASLAQSAAPRPPAELRLSEDAEPAARLVRLDVRVRPSHAVLSIDGQPLSSNPLVGSMVWDPHWHTLRGEAPGFEAFVTRFQLDSDVTIDATLQREPSGAVRRGGVPSAALAELGRRVVSAR